MLTAYNDASRRINPDFTKLGAGDIGGKTLTAGFYKWSSSLIIPKDIASSYSSNEYSQYATINYKDINIMKEAANCAASFH
jgi:hypothetical protein